MTCEGGVWQFQCTHGWKCYSGHLCKEIDKALRHGLASVSIMVALDDRQHPYTVNFSDMVQKADETGMPRKVRRCAFKCWEFSGREWHQYEPALSAQLETAFQSGAAAGRVQIGEKTYKVDFKSMKQILLDDAGAETGKVRDVRRAFHEGGLPGGCSCASGAPCALPRLLESGPFSLAAVWKLAEKWVAQHAAASAIGPVAHIWRNMNLAGCNSVAWTEFQRGIQRMGISNWSQGSFGGHGVRMGLAALENICKISFRTFHSGAAGAGTVWFTRGKTIGTSQSGYAAGSPDAKHLLVVAWTPQPPQPDETGIFTFNQSSNPGESVLLPVLVVSYGDPSLPGPKFAAR